MKTLAKFENACAKITFVMLTKQNEFLAHKGLYIVREEPKKKNPQWEATMIEFSHSNEANSYFKSLIEFWLK